MYRLCLTITLYCLFSASAWAGSVNLAVASNFINTARQLTSQFNQQSGHTLNISSGSTGKLYTQIVNGAPFDIFLAANAREPKRLEQQGQALAGSRFTYAIGRLALWSAEPGRVGGDCAETLGRTDFARLAIANPRVAPYGRQAENALLALGVYQALQGKLILGENIGQAFRFVSSKNAQLGIVSLAQVRDPKNTIQGSHCVIAETLHQPLLQQALVLRRAQDNSAVTEFMDFLRSAAARQVIRQYGYGLPEHSQ